MDNLVFNNTNSVLVEGIYTFNNRYFPGQPVQCATQIGSAVGNSGCEAWIELSKALKIVGDYRLSTPVNMTRWAIQCSATGELAEFDFDKEIMQISPTTGIPEYFQISTKTVSTSGTSGSSCFAMAINLETSNGVDISGLNAEEQSDISFMATWKDTQNSGSANVPSNLEVYTFVDSMLVLRENNMIELIK